MAHDMTATGMLAKNRLAGEDAWLILVKIDATAIGGSTYTRSSDESAATFKGLLFDPAALSFGDIQENLEGGLPRIDMKVSNLDTAINTAVNTYDGLRDAVVTVYIVLSGNIATNKAELTEVFTVIETTADNQWITFTLGFADPLGRRFPRDRYTSAICRHQYRITMGEITPFCRYNGPEPAGQTTCDHSLTHCQARGNTAQFGGSPGVNEGVYQ